MLPIHGLSKTTLLDYPGRVAAVIFLGRCNFRCPFCHNAGLVLSPESQPLIPEEEVIAFLKKRKGILQGICVTGGEPTLHKGLEDFLIRVKELDYSVKLDTNGYLPEAVKELTRKGLVDYIAMDIKGSLEQYGSCTGIADIKVEPIRESIRYVMEAKVDYEFRTTVVKELHSEENFHRIGRAIAGARRYFIQSYQDGEDIIAPGFHALNKEEINRAVRIMREYVEKVEVRGVDDFILS